MVALLQFLFIRALLVSYVAFVLSLFVPNLSFFWCFGRAVFLWLKHFLGIFTDTFFGAVNIMYQCCFFFVCLFTMNGYSWQIICHFREGRQFLWLSFCFPAFKDPSEKGWVHCNMKEIVPRKSTFFPFNGRPIFRKGQNELWKGCLHFPLKVYPFPWYADQKCVQRTRMPPPEKLKRKMLTPDANGDGRKH